MKKFHNQHVDKFIDYSVIHEDQQNSFIFPAVRENNEIVSHPGCAYGDIVFFRRPTSEGVKRAVTLVKDFYRSEGFDSIVIRQMPQIYASEQSVTAFYGWIADGCFFRKVNLHHYLDLSLKFNYNNNRRRDIKKFTQEKDSILKFCDSIEDYTLFLNVLESNLKKYQTKSKHTKEQFAYLMRNFSSNMFLLKASSKKYGNAYTWLWSLGPTLHAQYFAYSNELKSSASLSALIDFSINFAKESNFRFFSFGVSSDSTDQYTLNTGLARYKESFSAQSLLTAEIHVPLKK